MYKVKSESGPDHRKRFLVEVRLKPAEGEPGKPLARGLGSTKKHAEQDAARRALARLNKTRTRGCHERGAAGSRGVSSRMSSPAPVTGQPAEQTVQPDRACPAPSPGTSDGASAHGA